ncbi:MAG: hypothetical protein M1825_004618 [Sarcosagium campestre]|nr:MAG: hypothetical protein M1825_004618 [Sarcosagium campestre]
MDTSSTLQPVHRRQDFGLEASSLHAEESNNLHGKGPQSPTSPACSLPAEELTRVDAPGGVGLRSPPTVGTGPSSTFVALPWQRRPDVSDVQGSTHGGIQLPLRTSKTPLDHSFEGASPRGDRLCASPSATDGLEHPHGDVRRSPEPTRGVVSPASRRSGSPSKTLDSRRWSPTKASWLESALSKSPEPPKQKPAHSQQPSWMAEISRTRSQRGSVDLARGGANYKEVNTTGLMRAPPPGGHSKTSSISGLPAGFSVAVTPREDGLGTENEAKPKSPPVKTKPQELAAISTNVPRDSSGRAADAISKPERRPPTSASSRKENAGAIPGPQSTGSPKPKPQTPPKPQLSPRTDLRRNLKSPQPTSDSTGQQEPEFKNVFGNLKRTKTQNYVAPDELRNNILRGKAGLNVTGGPRPGQRRDEFKESLIKQKESMKVKAAEAQERGELPGRPTGSTVAQESSEPEALAKRSNLVRSGSNAALTGPQTASNAPEAIARQQTLRGNVGLGIWSRKESSSPVRSPADKFNPALASLLARGPPSAPSREGSVGSSNSNPTLVADDYRDGSKAQLTHATKGRARGPKRRLPTAQQTGGS